MKISKTYVYLKDNEISLWQKHYVWHKWLTKTPKNYADILVKNGYASREEAYGPCFWGMHEEAPEEKGYEFIGVLEE